MSGINDANSVLAILQLGEVVETEVAKKHAAGEHFTLGDLASVVAQAAVPTVEALGLADHPFRLKPTKRGRTANNAGAGAGAGAGGAPAA